MAPIPKCFTCTKIITKKSPGLECRVCKKVVHASTPCAALTSKQITALRAQVSLDWTCKDCLKNHPKQGSFIIPEEDSEEEEEGQANYPIASTPSSQASFPTIDVKKLLKDISKDVDKTITKALEPLNETMNEICESIEAFKERIIELEKKNASLANANKNMEIRLYAVEQRVHELEQGQLQNFIEVSGIPAIENENPTLLVKNLAKKLDIDESGIKTAKRLGNRGEKAGYLLVELQEENRNCWLQKARTVKPVIGDLIPHTNENEKEKKIFVREALTPYNKELLWKAKQQLPDTYKYVWVKDGKIRARKEDKSKVFIVRKEADIEMLLC